MSLFPSPLLVLRVGIRAYGLSTSEMNINHPQPVPEIHRFALFVHININCQSENGSK
jgi:hypothetical protein